MNLNDYGQMYNKPSLGYVRLIDGLFLGDMHASGDLNFLMLNKISHLVNCAGKEMPNKDFSDLTTDPDFTPPSYGLKFLTFYWLDDDRQLIFDEQDRVPKEIVRFIDEAIDQGTSVLIHSVRGQSRSSIVAILYFMEKFQWTLLKTLEFVNSRRPDLEIRANFLNQLQVYIKRSKTVIPEDHDENLNDVSEEGNAMQSERKRGAPVKTQRTEEFSDYISDLKMYKALRESGAETHSQILKKIEQKALVERTISNTFMNT